jgi:hypothetical protein
MAYYYGYQGSVKFKSPSNGLLDLRNSTTSIVNVTQWSLSIEKQIIETTNYTDLYAKKVGGIISGSGSLTLIYTATNSSFLTAINTNADPGTAYFELYISEADAKKITFNGVISKASFSATRDEVQTMSCEFVTNGAIAMNL